MIKIDRLPAPEELTPEVVAVKTAKFKADPTKSVWKEPYIEARLLEMSHNKCCYCECKIEEESKYMEVEHFHDKGKYPDEVVIWDNLLPSCRSCNGSKHIHDTIASPIVNPTTDIPSAHLAFKDFRYKAKDYKGEETITALNLNDAENKCLPRFKICNKLNEQIEDIHRKLEVITIGSRTQEINRLKNKVIGVLQECQCDSAYTAIKASMVLANPDFDNVVSEMKARDWWTPIMEELSVKMHLYALDLL